MNMCPILMIVSVPEQEIPDDFSRLLLKKTTLLLKTHFRHIERLYVGKADDRLLYPFRDDGFICNRQERDVKKYLWHIAIDYRLQIYNFYVRNGLFALTFLLFVPKVQPTLAIFFNEMLNICLRSKIFTE